MIIQVHQIPTPALRHLRHCKCFERQRIGTQRADSPSGSSPVTDIAVYVALLAWHPRTAAVASAPGEAKPNFAFSIRRICSGGWASQGRNIPIGNLNRRRILQPMAGEFLQLAAAPFGELLQRNGILWRCRFGACSRCHRSISWRARGQALNGNLRTGEKPSQARRLIYQTSH